MFSVVASKLKCVCVCCRSKVTALPTVPCACGCLKVAASSVVCPPTLPRSSCFSSCPPPPLTRRRGRPARRMYPVVVAPSESTSPTNRGRWWVDWLCSDFNLLYSNQCIIQVFFCCCFFFMLVLFSKWRVKICSMVLGWLLPVTFLWNKWCVCWKCD